MKNVINQTLYRDFRIDRRGIDEEKRTVELSFSSEEPCQRWFGLEILGHKAGEIRLDNISSGSAPLLKDHNRDQQIGVVESVRLAGSKCRAVVRLSKRAEADAEFQDIVDGIRSNVSVGYVPYAMEKTSEDETGPTYRVTDWEPLEISIVSIPADNSVGVGRNQGEEKVTIEISNENEKKRPRTLKREAAREAREEITEIISIGEKLNLNDAAREAVSEGWSLQQFRDYAMDALEKRSAQPPRQSFSDDGLGMSRREVNQYSVIKLARVMAFPNEPKFRQAAGLELDASEAETKRLQGDGISTKGYRIPIDVTNSWQTRTLTAGIATDGAELVGTNLMAGSFIDVLRNRNVCLSMGARIMHGLVGNVSIPRKTSGSVWAWLANEGDNVGNSEAQFDNITLTPKTGGAYTDLSRNLLLQGTPDAEQLIRDDLAQAASTGIDLACLYGTGADGQPKGIANQTGVNAPTNFAAAVPTWAEVVAMKSAVAVDNALMGSLGYVIEPAMQGSLQVTEKSNGTGKFILEDDGSRLAGYKCAVTSQVTDGDLFFGNWSDLIVGFWGGLDILADPYTLGLSGGLRLIVHQSCDVAVRHPVSFAYNNDGA